MTFRLCRIYVYSLRTTQSRQGRYKVAHTFLLEPGRWKIQGSWLERNGMPISVKGMTLVAWNRDNWFTMAAKLIFPVAIAQKFHYSIRGAYIKKNANILFTPT